MKKIVLFLFFLTLILYYGFYTGEQKHLNYFVPLADAFLHGRLYLVENPSWLNELIDIGGKYYVVYPPMPAVLLLPAVWLFGADFSQPLFSIFIAAINVSLCFIVLNRFFHSVKISSLMAVTYAFGSMQFYHAVIGSAWYIAHIIAMFFVWLMLYFLTREKRNYLLIGLFIGAAYWSRLPAVLAVLFPLLYCYKDFLSFRPTFRIHFRNWILLGLGIGFFVGLNFLYNFVRFGVIYDISYQLLPVFEEPWYQNGLFHVVNIPIHLSEIFFSLPTFSKNWPYVTPSLNVMALWFVMPFLFLILFVPIEKQLVWSVVLTVLVMSLPGLMHGSNGFTQFGFRFSLDYLPFLLLLSAAGIHKKTIWLAYLLVVLSILVTLWGMVYITLFKIWTM